MLKPKFPSQDFTASILAYPGMTDAFIVRTDTVVPGAILTYDIENEDGSCRIFIGKFAAVDFCLSVNALILV